MTKIMLVEDDKSLREIYGVRLVAEGYQIVSAGDGEEALAMAIKEKPDLIISDVMMPKISGFDMLDILRSTPETKDLKVIMMTALSSEDQRARGEALGANKYLVKSQVGIEDVVRAVHEVLADMPGAKQPSVFASPTAPQPTIATPSIQQSQQQPSPITPNVTSTTPITPSNAAMPPSQMNPTPMTTNSPASQAVNRTSSPLPFMKTPPIAQKTMSQATVLPSGAAQPQYIVPNATTNDQLPQPTAPFSSSAPASLGDNFTQAQNKTPSADIAKLMEQELSGATPTEQQPSTAPTTPTQPIVTPPSAAPVITVNNTTTDTTAPSAVPSNPTSTNIPTAPIANQAASTQTIDIPMSPTNNGPTNIPIS